jgi:glycosyltransferase involved in cell wall biosynthesis
MRVTRAAQPGSRIRVMAAIGSLGTGGSEKQLTEMLVRLPRERFDPLVVTIAADADSAPHRARLEGAGIPVRSLGAPSGAMPSRWLWLARRYQRVLRETQPDVVYAWLDEAAAYLAPLCRVRGVPCVVARRNIIGSMTERRNVALGRGIRLAETAASLVTANSGAVAEASVTRGHRRERIRLVTNGHEELPPLPEPPTPPVVFGYLAQLRPEKGHRRLLGTLSRMHAGEWRVDLAGDGELRGELQSIVSANGLDDRVRFVGAVPDARAFWADCHVAVLLSDSEGLPNALLEAAFAGRPVIATRTGGIPEVVGDRGGILVPLDDWQSIATAMQRLTDDAALRAEMAAEAWNHVAATYSLERMLAGHVSALEEAYESRGPHHPQNGRR